MKLYSFVNANFLSQLQCGNQTAHLVGRLATKYRYNLTSAGNLFWDWVENYETNVILNGGVHEDLYKLEDSISERAIRYKYKDFIYPYASFKESKECLNETITAVGVILPDRFFEQGTSLNEFEIKLRNKIVNAKKA